MQVITGLTDQPTQVFNLTLEDGSILTVTMTYRPQQIGWYYDLLWNGTTPSTQVFGRRIVTSPNMLRQFRNVWSFGLGCVTSDNYEPLNQSDFSSGYATLLLLDASDVAQIEQVVYPGL